MTREEAIKLLENDEERPCTDECCASFTCEECKFFQALNMALDALKEKRPQGEWREDSDDYDVRCSHCGLAIHELNKTNHERLNAQTGGKWWTHYRYCPMCGADMGGKGND